jgi:hypothetical protein
MHYLYTFTFSAIMKATRVLLCLFFGMCFITSIQAQFELPKYKDVVALKDLQPIVIIAEPVKEIIAKYNSKGDDKRLELYRNLFVLYNENMKTAIQKFWNFNSKGIVFKTQDEADIMVADKKQRGNYMFIYCYSDKRKQKLDWTIDENAKSVDINIFHLTYFAVGLPYESAVYKVLLPHILPDPKDLCYAVSRTNFYLNYVYNYKKDCSMREMIDENAHQLAKKTLLILNDEVTSNLLYNEIADYYPCNYQVVGKEVMARAIMSGDTDYAYVIWDGYRSNYHPSITWIVNCSDGATLGYTFTKDHIDFEHSNNELLPEQIHFVKSFFLDMADFCRAGSKK